MRIGMAQMDISWENIEDNKKKVEQFFKKAEENQVDCLVFPEMTLTGFSMNCFWIYRTGAGGTFERTSELESLL